MRQSYGSYADNRMKYNRSKNLKASLFPSMHQAFSPPSFLLQLPFILLLTLTHSHPLPSSSRNKIKQVGTGSLPERQTLLSAEQNQHFFPSKPPSYIMHATKFGNSGADVMTQLIN
uniref:Uncharacterized protein n=1 Tax=Sphaerodactylus townsendi TaxID=933632 RepID=A0ACB8FH95_9SAUR